MLIFRNNYLVKIRNNNNKKKNKLYNNKQYKITDFFYKYLQISINMIFTYIYNKILNKIIALYIYLIRNHT